MNDQSCEEAPILGSDIADVFRNKMLAQMSDTHSKVQEVSDLAEQIYQVPLVAFVLVPRGVLELDALVDS